MTSNPSRCSPLACCSSDWLSDVMGVMVFMISWVSTRMSFIHESTSRFASSLLMSLNATMRTRLLRSVV